MTTISGLDKNSSITYNNTDKITYEGTQSYGDTFIYNNVKEIEKKAVELNNYYSSSSNNASMSGGVGSGGWNSLNVSASGGNSNYTQEGTSYQNGIFVGVNETYNNVGKMTIDGFEQYGGKVTGNIAELDIKSKQNTSKTEGSSSNYSAGTNLQQIGTANGSKGIKNDGVSSWTLGGSSTTGERNYVDTPSAFVIGEGSDLSIGKVTNTGAVIGTEENSNGKIKIDEYTGKNIDNKDTYNTTGGTISTGGIGVEYQDKEKEGITHNTVVGNVEIGSSSGDEINTDINKMQETTKDKDSGHYNTFVESGVLELTTKEGREKFKESVGLAGHEVDRVLDNMVESYNTIKDIMASGKSDEEKAKEIISQGMESIIYYELISPSDIEEYNNGKVSELVKNNPDFIKEMEISKDKANDVLSTVGDLLGLDDINKIRQSEDHLKNLTEEVKLMKKIEELRKNRDLTDEQAREVMYGLYSVMYVDLLATKYLSDNVKIVEGSVKKIVEKYSEELVKGYDNMSSDDYKNLIQNISEIFIGDYQLGNIKVRVKDPENDPYFKITGDPDFNFAGIRKGVTAIVTKSLSSDEIKELRDNGYIVKKEKGRVELDFASKPEIWINSNNDINSKYKDIVYTAGTSGHEVGHEKDLGLKPKTKEERLIKEIFQITGMREYAGTDRNTPGYTLRGTELFQHELGNIIRVKISEEMNKINKK